MTFMGTKKAELPELPYGYDAMEPIIGKETMKLHHSGHHQTYVTNLNLNIEKLQAIQVKGEASEMPKQIEIMDLIKFNGGGHINHCLYWENLKPFDKSNEENLPRGN